MEAWWCGARKGGRSSRTPSGRGQPAAEWMRVTASAFVGGERREQPGQALGQHLVSARPGWPDHEQVVAAGGRRPRTGSPAELLTAHVGAQASPKLVDT